MAEKVSRIQTSPTSRSLQKLPDVCRICLKSGSSEENAEIELYRIEDIYVQRSSLIELITSFRDILTIFVNDEMNTHGGILPSIICLQCANRAQEAYKFVEQCRRTDQLLASHFAMPKLRQNCGEENQSSKTILAGQSEASSSFEHQEEAVTTKTGEDGDGNLQCETPKKRFFCDKCNKSFSQSQTMRRHYRSHDTTGSSIKPCMFCDKTFLRSDDLTRHVRTHTGERPYKCNLCPKAYKQWSELNEHCLTHTSNRLYKCTECSRELTSRNGLYVHMKVHRGEKPFVCLHCSKRFTTSSELISHMRRIHPQAKTVDSDVKRMKTR